MSKSPDDRSPIARAAAWSSRIMTVSLEMVLPGMLGYWLDMKLGTKVLFLLVGMALGAVGATVHLVHMTRSEPQSAGGRKGGQVKSKVEE